MKTVYILTSQKLNGYIELTYTDGFLTAVLISIKEPLKIEQFDVLWPEVSYFENDISQLAAIGFTITRQAATNEKIALFCHLYEKYKSIKYKVSPADSGKIKLIKVDEKLLEHYFSSQSFLFKAKHSISNLVKYYNELLAEIASANKSKHPNGWDKAYEDKLKKDEVYEYWRHLCSLGLQPKKDRQGNTIDWVPKEHL